MAYEYANARYTIFTDSGVQMLISLRDQVKAKSAAAGAVRFEKLSFTGSSWTALACMDYMIERKDIVRINQGNVAAHDELYCWIG